MLDRKLWKALQPVLKNIYCTLRSIMEPFYMSTKYQVFVNLGIFHEVHFNTA